MLKGIVPFFVLQLLKIILLVHELHNDLIKRFLKSYSAGFQFSVFGSGFSVLAPASTNFNSLYRAINSLKKIK